MKKYNFLLLVPVMVVVLCLAWYTVSMIFNPILRPAPMIRNHILRHTPIGMYMEEVIEVIKNNERWGTPEINTWSGFVHPSPQGSPWDYDGRVGPLIVGEKQVQTRHRYSIPLFFDRIVRILWGFDENGKLVEVYVDSVFGT